MYEYEIIEEMLSNSETGCGGVLQDIARQCILVITGECQVTLALCLDDT